MKMKTRQRNWTRRSCSNKVWKSPRGCMDPSTLKSELDKFYESEVDKFYDYEGPPSPEREVMATLRAPFSIWLTAEEAEADVMEVYRRVMKKRHREE